MSIYDTLKKTGLPVAYNQFEGVQELPFLVYLGAGQDVFEADNSYYVKRNNYQIEYYFRIKDEDVEETIENILMADGYKYDKSDDSYIESDDIFVIYYTV